jgi:esterase/lipase
MKILVLGLWMLIPFFIPISVYADAEGAPAACELPTKPVVPNAATAERWMMERAIEKVRKYNKDMKRYIECMKERLDFQIRETNELNEEMSRALRLYKDINEKYKMR